MTEQVGTLLATWRTAAGLSLGQLARRAGISKSALSQWEAGLRQPRIPELEAALAALGVTPAQRTQALACIEAPRAIRLLNAPSAMPGIGPLPGAGDLLRALRLRRGWTQAELAQRLSVGQNTVARWEQGERLPSAEQIQALCFVLDAQEEELIALTAGRFEETFGEIPLEPDAVTAYLSPLIHDPRAELVDLRFFLLERALWQRAGQDEQIPPLLAKTYAHHAHYLSLHRRWGEVETMAQRALSFTPSEGPPPDYTLHAVLKVAAAEVYGGNRPLPERGFHRIKPWLSRSSDSGYTSWILSDMAKYLAMMGQGETALDLGVRAIEVSPEERLMRQMDLGQLLLQIGDPGKALEQIPTLSPKDRAFFLYEALIRCEAHLALSEHEEAAVWLKQAYATMDQEGFHHNRAQADALAQKF